MDHQGKTERLGPREVDRAAELLRRGGTVAFPTETVYGLGANALDAAVVAKIFEAKGRPAWDPVIVHVSDLEMLARVAVIPSSVEVLMGAIWPGPLTLLLPKTSAVPDIVTAGRALVGVRMPQHALALKLIAAAGVPIAAPSANQFGHTSPTVALHVLDDLDGRIDAVLDGGAADIGLESTVFDPAAGLIYRPGAITAAMLSEITGAKITVYAPRTIAEEPASLPSPGVGMRHYAPRARLVLVRSQKEMLERVGKLLALKERVGVMLPGGWGAAPGAVVFQWTAWKDIAGLARGVFAGLRELDAAGVAVIVCPVPPIEGLGAAINDRLNKAARH